MKVANAWLMSTVGQPMLRGRLSAGVVNHLALARRAAVD